MDKKLKAEAKRERRMQRKKNPAETISESPDDVASDVDEAEQADPSTDA